MKHGDEVPLPLALRSEREVMSSWVTQQPPLVSVVCSTFNHEPYISDALRGFLGQETDFPFEVIVRDDASKDRTADVIRQFASDYPSIVRPIYELENQYSKGVKPVSRLLHESRGDLIAICEGDDYWTDAHKLQKQADFLIGSSEYSGCFTNAVTLNEFDGTVQRYVKRLVPGDVPIEQIIRIGGFIYPTASMMYRRGCYCPEEREFLRDLAGDTTAIVTCALRGKVHFFDDITCVYRRWEGGVYSGISRDRTQVARWKRRNIRGYERLNEFTGGKYSKVCREKISRDAQFIIENDAGFDRLKYVFKLRLIDLLKLFMRP